MRKNTRGCRIEEGITHTHSLIQSVRWKRVTTNVQRAALPVSG